MDEPTTSGTERVLVIGRSPSVILDAAGILRSKGFHADATNQFDEVLTEYDTTKNNSADCDPDNTETLTGQ